MRKIYVDKYINNFGRQDMSSVIESMTPCICRLFIRLIYLQNCLFINASSHFGCLLSDSRSPDSSSVSSPPSGQRSPPLVPSAAASMTSLPPITSAGVNSPISSIGSPFSVISSSLGSPCLPGTPSVGYGPISSPQVREDCFISGIFF